MADFLFEVCLESVFCSFSYGMHLVSYSWLHSPLVVVTGTGISFKLPNLIYPTPYTASRVLRVDQIQSGNPDNEMIVCRKARDVS